MRQLVRLNCVVRKSVIPKYSLTFGQYEHGSSFLFEILSRLCSEVLLKRLHFRRKMLSGVAFFIEWLEYALSLFFFHNSF